MTVTPRTDIVGAHHGDGVSIGRAGQKLSRSSSSLHASTFNFQRVILLVALAGIVLATDWIPAKSYLGSVKQHLSDSYSAIRYLPTGFQFVAFASILVATYFAVTAGKPYVLFAWNCFIKPFLKRKPAGIDSEDHQRRLEQFYEGQADIYDVTRRR